MGANGTNGATGTTGATGISITTSQILHDSLYVTLSNNQIINAGFLGISTTLVHYIGQLYGGGIVVSVWKDSLSNEHGLIASLTDIGSGTAWSNIQTAQIGSGAESYRNGQANTVAIISQSGQTSSAALLCHNYVGGGYSDWYLPSILELQQCYNAALIVNLVLGDSNGFSQYSYWSSTEQSNSAAWAKSLGLGNVNNDDKSNPDFIRAVRAY